MAIRPAILIQLAKIGFKLVPLDAESKKPTMPWTEIYDNAGWTLTDLSKHYDKFYNVATCFGMTTLPDGKTAYLNCLDIDSKQALEKLKNIQNRLDKTGRTRYNLIEEAKQRTYVTQSWKGYHIYWLTDHELEPVHTHEVEPEWSFEVKTNKDSGLVTLPPSIHRNHPEFAYFNIGKPQLDWSQGMYDVIMRELGDKVHRKVSTPYIPKRSEIMREIFSLTDEQVKEIASCIALLAWTPGLRHQTSLALSGFLCKWGVDFDSAEKVFRELIRLSKDEEKQARLADLKKTYKDSGKRKLAGYMLLKGINPDAARRMMQIVSRIEGEKKNGK